MFLLENKLLNDRLIREHRTRHNEIFALRVSRMKSSLRDYMSQNYSVGPKPTLQNLLDRISRYDQYFQETTHEKWNTKKQQTQTLIDTNQYAAENTADYQYHINYFNHLNSFQWPDSNELAIRAQEETELLALLGQ